MTRHPLTVVVVAAAVAGILVAPLAGCADPDQPSPGGEPGDATQPAEPTTPTAPDTDQSGTAAGASAAV